MNKAVLFFTFLKIIVALMIINNKVGYYVKYLSGSEGQDLLKKIMLNFTA